MIYPTDPPMYSGLKRKLVLAFDIGTTYSGISYSILDPGQTPEIRGVTRFPAHEQLNGASKIPTVLYYNQAGVMVAAGAEAVKEGIYETATEEGWIKTEWFKLHVRSKRGTSLNLENMLPPLPESKSVVQILSDFMKYLHKCARSYIEDTHAIGQDLWASVEKDIAYVITHPNGWEGYQQSQMYDAAILAGLIPDSDDGKKRVTFLTEGEASLHHAIRNGLPEGAMDNGEGVIIVDAGGGTVDVSAYRKHTEHGVSKFEEIAVPQCHFFGSVFVSIYAKIFLTELLADSPFIEDLDHIVQRFDSTTKLQFRNANEPQFIRFGGNRDTDLTCGIRFGQLKLAGKDVASFFTPSADCIVNTVLSQVKKSHNPISHVILVGGFASSDWIYSEVKNALSDKGLSVIRPGSYVNKAVSEGAISFYVDHQVNSRVSKYTYGPLYVVTYDPKNPEHQLPQRKTFISNITGQKRIRGSFEPTIPKASALSLRLAQPPYQRLRNTKIKEFKEYREHSCYRVESLNDLRAITLDLWCYRGNDTNPKWDDEEPEMYSRLCQIVVDLSHLPYETCPRAGNQGVYYMVNYDYVMFYQGVELKAQIAWTERDGSEKRSPASVVYDPTD